MNATQRDLWTTLNAFLLESKYTEQDRAMVVAELCKAHGVMVRPWHPRIQVVQMVRAPDPPPRSLEEPKAKRKRKAGAGGPPRDA